MVKPCYNKYVASKLNNTMKLTEVIQPSTKSIFESLKEENNHSFSEGTLQEISESISNAKFTGKAMTTMEEVDAWIASL